MPVTHHPTTALLLLSILILALYTNVANADSVTDIRKHLFENQRNVIMLRKEKEAFIKELQEAEAQRELNTETDAIDAEILEIKDSIEVAKILIKNLSELVAQQRLSLATLESGTPPSALDIALNKALNSNLPELLKNLSTNPAAHKDIARLKALLKQQARLSTGPNTDGNSVSLAKEQQVAEDEFLRLLALFSRGNADEAEDKTIRISGINNNAPYDEKDILSYLGHEQYHMETTVYSGTMTFMVDGRPWELEVPTEENEATYIIIYDIGKEEPRLVMFNKSLLLE